MNVFNTSSQFSKNSKQNNISTQQSQYICTQQENMHIGKTKSQQFKSPQNKSRRIRRLSKKGVMQKNRDKIRNSQDNAGQKRKSYRLSEKKKRYYRQLLENARKHNQQDRTNLKELKTIKQTVNDKFTQVILLDQSEKQEQVHKMELQISENLTDPNKFTQEIVPQSLNQKDDMRISQKPALVEEHTNKDNKDKQSQDKQNKQRNSCRQQDSIDIKLKRLQTEKNQNNNELNQNKRQMKEQKVGNRLQEQKQIKEECDEEIQQSADMGKTKIDFQKDIERNNKELRVQSQNKQKNIVIVELSDSEQEQNAHEKKPLLSQNIQAQLKRQKYFRKHLTHITTQQQSKETQYPFISPPQQNFVNSQTFDHNHHILKSQIRSILLIKKPKVNNLNGGKKQPIVCGVVYDCCRDKVEYVELDIVRLIYPEKLLMFYELATIKKDHYQGKQEYSRSNQNSQYIALDQRAQSRLKYCHNLYDQS